MHHRAILSLHGHKLHECQGAHKACFLTQRSLRSFNTLIYNCYGLIQAPQGSNYAADIMVREAQLQERRSPAAQGLGRAASARLSAENTLFLRRLPIGPQLLCLTTLWPC